MTNTNPLIDMAHRPRIGCIAVVADLERRELAADYLARERFLAKESAATFPGAAQPGIVRAQSCGVAFCTLATAYSVVCCTSVSSIAVVGYGISIDAPEVREPIGHESVI